MIKVTYKFRGIEKTVYKEDREEAEYYVRRKSFIADYTDFKIGNEELEEVEKETNNTKIEKMPKLQDF